MATTASQQPGTGPLALVTGASSGIGRQVATELARRGYRTLLVARRRDRIEALARELSAFAPAQAVPLDLADAEAIEPTVTALLGQHGPVRVLVNNAGYGLYRRVLECTPDEHRRLMQVNYFAAVSLIMAVLPRMLPLGGGHVINIASISTKTGPWGHGAYAAAKSALVTLTQTLSVEYAGTGVHFSYVNPGMVDTEFFDAPEYAALARRYRRRAISAERVARKIVRLLDRPELELCVPRHYRVLDWLGALSPGLLSRLVGGASRPQPITAAPDAARRGDADTPSASNEPRSQ